MSDFNAEQIAFIRARYAEDPDSPDLAVKRRILDLYEEIKGADEQIQGEWNTSPENADALLDLLSAPYQLHPDYRNAWLPSPLIDGIQHRYEPAYEYISVEVCVCGKWPMHHVHEGVTPELCSCDAHTIQPA